jgi:DNA mismatch repair protein MLH3
MFNDVLTLEECKDLVQRLAKCAFPFQCAHGRPSMVPIVDLGVGNTSFGSEMAHEKKVGSGELLRDLRSWAKKKKKERKEAGVKT